MLYVYGQGITMQRNWYVNFNLQFTFIDYIIDRCKKAEYPIDRSNNRRAAFDYDHDMREKIEAAFLGAKPYDIGCMLWPAGIGFKWHKDRYANRNFRQSAINILLSPDVEENYSEFCDVNPDLETYDPNLHYRERTKYTQNGLLMLNPKEWHRVVNNSDTDRYLFTIGFPDENDAFIHLKERFLKQELFNPDLVRPI